MPEIKNQVKNSPSVTPTDNNTKLFEFPERRRSYGKFVGALIGLLVLLGAGYFAYAQYTKLAPAPVVQTPPVPEEKIVPAGTSYYLAYDQDDTEARIYRYSEESSKPDEKIGVIPQKNLRVVGKYTKPYTYVTTNSDGNKLQLLDATTAKLELFFDLPAQAIVGQVAVSNDKKYLAYGRTYEGIENDSYGEIWLYNIETKEQKQLVDKTSLGLYQSFSVLGWRDNDSELIVSAIGGDAGAIWGDIYQVDASTGKFSKLKNPDEKNMRGFLLGQLSPNGEQWLYEFCAQPDTVARESEANADNACTSGTELRVYDFGSQQTKTVYQNVRYEDNADKSSLRTFMSYIWQDDKTIIAAAPGTLLTITVGSADKTAEILTYDRFNPQAFKTNYLGLDAATPGAVVFTRDDSWHVFDRVSQKLVNINTFDRKERITAWLN